MENCSSPSKNINTRKQAIRRRSSFGLIAEDLNIRLYSQDDLKMFVFLCLINRFEEQKQKCLQSYDKQAEAKLNKTGTHFNRTSSTIIIEPLKKQAIQLKSTSLILQQLSQIIQQNLLNQFKKSSKRRSHNVTTSAFNQLVMTQSAEQTAVNSRVLATSTSNQLKSNLSNINDVSPKTKTLIKANIQKGKQNVGRNSQSRQIFHRRMISSEVGSSKFSLKQNHDSAKRQKFFMLRKKQQLNFLNKITFNFSSQEAEFKAMVEIMQIFLKNLSRSNYYLKIIDQSITKNHKIVVYIQQLLKVFSNIISIFTQLSGQHKVLNLKQCEPVIKSQISYLLPLIQQYYEKSNETIKIMRHFSVSPIFATFMTPQKDKCSKLITLFVQARYLLRYMEKEIENLEPRKKDSKNIPKWQRAFRVKFLPKNSLF